MEISEEKSKDKVNSNKDTLQAHITMNGETLEQVGSFKYLGALYLLSMKMGKVQYRNQSNSVHNVKTIKNVEESKNFNCNKDKTSKGTSDPKCPLLESPGHYELKQNNAHQKKHLK